MSVAAVRREIASLEAYGHLHVADAEILCSRDVLGGHVSPEEHALLVAFKERVDAGYLTSSRAARDTLGAVVAAGPSPFPQRAGHVLGNALKWGVGLALVAAVIGGAAAALTTPDMPWRGAALAGGAVVSAGVGGGAGLLIGSFRAARD